MKVGTPDNSVTEAKRPQKMNRRGRNKTDLDDKYEETSEIVGEKMVRKKKQYLVRFLDDSMHLCDSVTQPLLQRYREHKIQNRSVGRMHKMRQ